jgi:hypothetical protein
MKGSLFMPKEQSFEESLKAVHDAEEAVYEAQSDSNVKERQEALIQLQIAREKVQDAQKQLDKNNKEGQHRLEQALEQLHNLEEAEHALED